MGVKDLVVVFEPSPARDASVSVRKEKTTRSEESRGLLVGNNQARRRIPSTADESDDDLPPPTPARFIQHGHGKLDLAFSDRVSSAFTPHTLQTAQDISLPHSTFNDTAYDHSHDKTSDVTDEWRHSKPRNPQIVGSFQRAISSPMLTKYPPNHDDTLTSPVAKTSTYSSSSTLVSRHRITTHTPVPATIVFSRKAAPLFLPKLDNFLATLPAPSFRVNSLQKKGKDTGLPMFPPMDKLSALGKSIEDLETNSTVAPTWRNRKSIFSYLTNIFLGITGSSALATFYSLQGLFNTVQIFALLLSTIVSPKGIGDDWRRLFLGTIPNVLALNFASTLVQSLLFLIIFMLISSLLLFYFYRTTSSCLRYPIVEGLQQLGPTGGQWGLMIMCFILTIIYLPLSTMAVHVLVWSDDLWVIPNPYVNATSFPPVVSPLGPPDQFRDPLDFCWTTTMKRNEINFAPAVVLLSVVVLITFTFWFPLSLLRIIRQAAPKVDLYTELGKPRSKSDMNREYQRLLSRDRNPLAFLYKGFRRDWGTFESTYLFAKLSTLLIVAVIDPDNCFFRSLSRTKVAIVRQVFLLVATIVFFVVHCFLTPFLDPVNNASEWTSRVNYVLTSVVSLLLALNVPGKDILNGLVLYIIYICTYGLTFYFAIINTSLMHRVVKRLARRIDFSIDIFSPRLDISSASPHTRRRIWQESITALLLTSPECKIPATQQMVFVQARDFEYPPYLLDFSESPGERHVENLKILKEIGSLAYSRAVALISGPDYAWFQRLEEEIQRHSIGPDCYWKNPYEPNMPGCTNFFGNAWWIPFPPTLVIRYDDGPLAVIDDVSDLETYVIQNRSHDIRRRREIRMSLRALEGQTVTWPYEYIQVVGSRSSWCCNGRRFKAQTSVHFNSGVLIIKRNGHLMYQDLELGSGFGIELTYAKDVRISGEAIGINDDYDLTPPLARFLALNESLIPEKLDYIETMLNGYRSEQRKDFRVKSAVLSYRFLPFVYDQPREPTGLAESSIEFEQDLRVRQLMLGNEAVFQSAFERLALVSNAEAATWWYIFWDDLWRRNHDTISALELHATDFDPHYPTSIAYSPLPRPALEAFLFQRGLFYTQPKWGYFFHPGFLNKLYLRLNDIVFHGSENAIMLHLGQARYEMDMEDMDLETQLQHSTLGTGGGTDHDDASIRARPAYRWEGLLEDPLLGRGKKQRRHWNAKMGAWFGITPLWRAGIPSKGLGLDVRLENGRYVLIDGGQASDSKTTKAPERYTP